MENCVIQHVQIVFNNNNNNPSHAISDQECKQKNLASEMNIGPAQAR